MNNLLTIFCCCRFEGEFYIPFFHILSLLAIYVAKLGTICTFIAVTILLNLFEELKLFKFIYKCIIFT